MSDLSDDSVCQGLNRYLVGGAVRDQILGRAVYDRDWVVVGSTAEDMLARGFHPVGADFPVFLHPHTGEEYALARTERKTRSGHQGFEFYAATDVTLEQDLSRRDFTINAMAQSLSGELIDPFDGQKDLARGRLHPVSDAFNEDPLRILRAARFMAQMPQLQVSDDFLDRLPSMLHEIKSLSPERLWQETYKAFSGQPDRYFQALTDWNIWSALDLPNPPIAQPKQGGDSEQTIANWLWMTRGKPAPWLVAFKAPKRFIHLHQDVARKPDFETLLAVGALKQTPRAARLIDCWIQNEAVDAQALAAGLAAARAVKAQDMDPSLQGPALGQALRAAQTQAFDQAFSR